MKERDRLPIFLRILEVTVNRLNATLQGGLQLLQAPHQYDQFWRAERRLRSTFGDGYLDRFRRIQLPPQRLGATGHQLRHSFPAQTVEFADRQHHAFWQRAGERTQHKGRAP